MKQNCTPSGDSIDLAKLVDRLTLELVSGRDVNLDQICEQHPLHAEQLRSLLPAITAVANLGDSSGTKESQPPAQSDQPFENRTIGDYRIQREIGRGGMGVVYEAQQLSLNRKVALKVLPFASLLDERQLQRFKNEARAAASLRHPNIVTVHGVGSDRSVHYYAMDLIEGSDLATAIRRIHQETLDAARQAENAPSEDALSQETHPLAQLSTEQSGKRSNFFRSVAKLAIQAADALQHAHSAGVVHRDIKPANLLLDKEGALHVTDFGLARIPAQDELTLTGDLVGTLRYMSPEQINGLQLVDARSDVYSLGLTIYELLTGRPANTGESRADLVRRASDPSPRQLKHVIPDIPADLQTIIDTATSANPNDRYQSANAFSDDLKAFIELRTIQAKPSTQRSRLHRFAKRNPALTVACGATLLSAMLVAVVASLWASEAAQQATTAAQQATTAAQQATTAAQQATTAAQQATTAAQQATTAEQQASDAARQAATANEIARKQRISLYAADMRAAKAIADERKLMRLQEVLLRWVPDPNVDEADLREFEWNHLWKYCEDPAVVHTFDHELPCSQVRFLDDDRVVMLGFSRRAKVFSLREPDMGPKQVLQSPASNLDALAFHPTSHQLAIGDGGGNVTTWDARSAKQLFQTNAHAGEGENNSAETLAFNADGTQLLLGGGTWQEGFVRLWTLPEQSPILKVSRVGEACAVFGPDDSVIVSSYGEGYLSVFEQGRWDAPRQIELEADGVWRIAVNDDRSLVAIGAFRQFEHFKTWQMQVFETNSWQQVWSFDLPSTPDTIEFPRDSRLLAWGDESGTAWLARLQPETRTAKIELRRKLHGSAVSGIDISPSGACLATSSWDGSTTVWNLGELKQRHPVQVRYAGQDFWPSGAAFMTADSKTAAVVVRYEGVFLWNSLTGDVVSKLPIDVGDGTNLQVSTSDSGKICVAMGM